MAKLRPSFFDVPYGIPSARVTTGVTVISTTGGDYFSSTIKAGATAEATLIVYDNASTTSGSILDIIIVASTLATSPERPFILKAKNGITVSLTGTDSQASVFYGPKG